MSMFKSNDLLNMILAKKALSLLYKNRLKVVSLYKLSASIALLLNLFNLWLIPVRLNRLQASENEIVKKLVLEK